MIAGEQKFVSVKQYGMAASMTRDRNRHQVLIELHRIVALNYLFDAKPRSAIIRMHDSLAMKLLCKALMIGDVVFMS